MFKFITTNSGWCHNLYDISTLEDIALGVLNDETEAKRVAAIAGNMKFDDTFLAADWTLLCMEEY